MAALPQFQTDDYTMQLLQNKWSAVLNPIIANPVNGSIILKNVKLSAGLNSIPHLLQQNLQGWSIVRKRGPAEIYDTQDSNQSPQLTLKLVSDTAVSVDLMVF